MKKTLAMSGGKPWLIKGAGVTIDHGPPLCYDEAKIIPFRKNNAGVYERR